MQGLLLCKLPYKIPQKLVSQCNFIKNVWKNSYKSLKRVKMGYRRRWLLSVGAYSFCQQENERLTANMRLIGIPLITMGGVVIINASGLEYGR